MKFGWEGTESDPRAQRMLVSGSAFLWANATEEYRDRCLNAEDGAVLTVTAVMFLQCLRIMRNVARAAEKVALDPAPIRVALNEYAAAVPDLEEIRGFATYHASYVAKNKPKPFGRRRVVPDGYQLIFESRRPGGVGIPASAMTMKNLATDRSLDVIAAAAAARTLGKAIRVALREPDATGTGER